VDFLVRHRSIVALISFSLFCIISLSVQGGGFTLTFEGVMSAIVTPFSKGYNAISKGIGGLFSVFEDTSTLRENLRKAEAKLEKYESMQNLPRSEPRTKSSGCSLDSRSG
jgi:cell shape-determining protein MreC